MNVEVFKIKQELEKEPFLITKVPEQFAELIYSAYWKKDIVGELRKMRLWVAANPRRAKSNYKRFITNWMNRVR